MLKLGQKTAHGLTLRSFEKY